jgi:hypothetical protein
MANESLEENDKLSDEKEIEIIEDSKQEEGSD